MTSSTSTPQDDQLTKDIYAAMQIPYLSERHDAIKAIIDRTVAERVLEELERFYEFFRNEGILHDHNDSKCVSIDVLYEELEDRIAELRAAVQTQGEQK